MSTPGDRHETTAGQSGPDADRSAKAVLDKATADAAKAKAEAETAAAEARSARAKAAGDERDDAAKDTALAGEQRTAEARKAIAEAQQATAAAQREQIAALIPDLSKVERGSVEMKGDQPLFAAALARRALDAAALNLVHQVQTALTGNPTLLITSDAELASSDAAYLDVVTGLDQLRAAADAVLVPATEQTSAPAHGPDRVVQSIAPVVTAIAQALPAAFSLFSAHRTVSTSTLTPDDLAAAAAAAGALRRTVPDAVLVHDDVRLLSRGNVHAKLTELLGKRQQLSGRKIALEDEKARVAALLTAARGMIDDLKVAIATATGDAAAALAKRLADEREQVAGYEEQLSKAEVRLGLIDSVLEGIDTFVTSLTVVPAGARRSPLGLAAMRERLHPETATADDHNPLFTHVLLVKGGLGSTQQSIDDKPLWFADRFSTLATATITFMLLDVNTSALLAAGNPSGSVAATGKIGGQFEVAVKPVPLDG